MIGIVEGEVLGARTGTKSVESGGSGRPWFMVVMLGEDDTDTTTFFCDENVYQAAIALSRKRARARVNLTSMQRGFRVELLDLAAATNGAAPAAAKAQGS